MIAPSVSGILPDTNDKALLDLTAWYLRQLTPGRNTSHQILRAMHEVFEDPQVTCPVDCSNSESALISNDLRPFISGILLRLMYKYLSADYIIRYQAQANDFLAKPEIITTLNKRFNRDKASH